MIRFKITNIFGQGGLCRITNKAGFCIYSSRWNKLACVYHGGGENRYFMTLYSKGSIDNFAKILPTDAQLLHKLINMPSGLWLTYGDGSIMDYLNNDKMCQ